MASNTGIFSSPQGRRLAGAMAVLAAVILLVAVASTVRDLRITEERQTLDAVATESRSYARELRTRLAAGELVVQTLIGDDAGAGGSLLRARVLRSEIIHGVMLAAPGQDSGPVSINNADRLALSAGGTLLRSGPRPAGECAAVPRAHGARGGRSGHCLLRAGVGVAVAGAGRIGRGPLAARRLRR